MRISRGGIAGNSHVCGTYPTLKPLRAATLPEVGFSCPARIFRRVDFPDPFGPMSPIRSPAKMLRDKFLNKSLVAMSLESDWQLMRRVMVLFCQNLSINCREKILV